MPMDRARETLKQAMSEKGWSAEQLSRQSNVSREAVGRFLANRGTISPNVLRRLAKALDIKI